jgi:ribosomal protein S8
MAVVELANMLGNITNALNYECQSAELKSTKIEQLELKIRELSESARVAHDRE